MKKSHWIILGLPWVPFLVFWFKPFTVYRTINTFMSNEVYKADTLKINFNLYTVTQLDSVRKSYDSKNYIFPKPPYFEVAVEGLKDSSKMRFKGDCLSHIQKKQWSFRLKNKHEEWLGLKKVNFHHPIERSNIKEFVFQKHMAVNEHLSLTYDFSIVSKNREDQELYAFEEHQ